MIALGYTADEKRAEVARYCASHGVRKAFVLSPLAFRTAFSPGVEVDYVDWPEIIQYTFFYRLLQEIGKDTLVVVDECLRTQDRNCLTYNCIRHFLNQAGHQLVFQYLPAIDTVDDFMTLFDFDTRSRWKREKFSPALLSECQIETRAARIELREVGVETDDKTRAAYAKEKRKLIDGIGLKDPHTIPRNLYLMSGKARRARVDAALQYVGRNNRFALDNMQTYKEDSYARAPYTVFELPHNFIDFADFLSLSRQTALDVLVADLKVDRWYFDRYTAWAGRVRDAYAAIQR